MAPRVVGTQDQAALYLSPQAVLQPPLHLWGRKDALLTPALPLSPLGCLLLQLASPAAPLPEPKQAWGRSARNGGAAGLCHVGKSNEQLDQVLLNPGWVQEQGKHR